MNNWTGHDRFVLWIMGPTSSGKTTFAQAMLAHLRANGKSAIHYDGDEVRNFFGADHGFSDSDRLKVVKTLVHLANKAIGVGLNVVVSALTANEDARVYVRKNTNNLIVVYLDCSIEKCMKRDPRGLYKKAMEGDIQTVIGFNTKYVAPKDPDIFIDTETKSVGQCVCDFIEQLREFDIEI